jgi:hypothetical protein
MTLTRPENSKREVKPRSKTGDTDSTYISQHQHNGTGKIPETLNIASQFFSIPRITLAFN